MFSISERVGVLDNCEEVGLVLVQFGSPFTGDRPELDQQHDYKGDRLHWKEKEHVQNRLDRFRALLNKLVSQDVFSPTVPAIVAFPEYSIPKEAHEGLQDFVNANNCILIPGSYYEDREDSALFRNNVCIIYLPNQRPISIIKKHGFRAEQDALSVRADVPSIAHLIGSNSHLPQFSVSVAICRDYLMPYGTAANGSFSSLLDWQHSGLNLVVMCSAQMSLFEARAAFDIRGLPGPRRITALCNCSGYGIEGRPVTGSAIIGPKENPDDSVGDVIESLRGDQEGILTTVLHLNNSELARVEWKPDKKLFVPIKRVFKYSTAFLRDDADQMEVQLDEIKESGPMQRGVWHPAFLTHIERRIVMHLFPTRQYERVKEVVDNKRIRGVTALAVEGKHDVLFRYYKAGDSAPNLPESYYSTLTPSEFADIFDVNQQVAIVVQPEDIIKFRSIPIVTKSADPKSWNDRMEKIAALIPKNFAHPRRSDLLAKASKLAQDWNDPSISETERKRLAPVFFDKREAMLPVSSYESGRINFREKYILVSVGTTDETKLKQFELEIVTQWLLPMDEVRSIYHISKNIESVHFDYWVDVYAEPWRIAEIVLGISARGYRLKLYTGTRTMEVLKFYTTESNQGIHTTDFGRTIELFLYDSRKVDEQIASRASAEEFGSALSFLTKCSEAWYQQHEAPEGPRAKALTDDIRKFYAYLFWGNIERERDVKEEHLIKAGTAWGEIFQHLEVQFEFILRRHLRCSDQDDVWAQSELRLRQLEVSDKELAFMRKNAAQLVFAMARKDVSFIWSLPSSISETLETYSKRLAPFRNKMIHAQQAIVYLQVFTTPKRLQDGWTIDQIVSLTADLISLVNGCNDY